MNRILRAALACLAVVGGLCHGAAALAQGPALDAFPVKEKIKIDGLLREWPALVDLSYGPDGSTSAKGLVGYDAERLYVVMHITDDYLKRTSSYGPNEDVARLVLGFPGRQGVKVHKVELFPGDPGKVPGAVKVDGTKVTGSKLVEAPKPGGYTFEAVIPWDAFPEAKFSRVGLTAALQYKDFDGGASKGTLSTAPGDELEPLSLEAEYSMKQSLLRRAQITAPSRQAFGDVAGDGFLERVAIFGRYLVIAGWGYRGGNEFYFQDTGVGSGSDVKRLELMDLTGDGKDEILLQKRVTIAGLEREIFQIWSIDKGKEAPFAALSAEVGLFADGKKVENRVRIEAGGKNKRIRISQAASDEDIDPKAVEQSGGEGLQAALMPWDSVQSRAYEWNGRSFSSVGEETGKPKVSRAQPASAGGGESAALPANTPPPPRPPTPDELMDRVYALYKNEHKVGNAKPRFDFATDVAADRTAERVLIHGKDLVVFGKAFQDGASYVYLSIGVEDPSDITGATAFDVTGDGKAEIIVYGMLRAKASKNMGGQTITRQVMFIYQARESGVRRIFCAETGRSQDDKAIVGRVRFLPAGKGRSIELAPGHAVGWEQGTYPYPADRFPYGGFEPLLLPWTDMPVRKYTYDGDAFTTQ